MSLTKILLLFTTCCTGLMAGLFYAWSFVVVLGLSKLDHYSFVETVQHFNREILNPAFYFFFFGAAVGLPVLSLVLIKSGLPKKLLVFALLATACYWLGCMLVTIVGNLPLNYAIEAVDLSNSSEAEIKQARLAYESRWNALNLIRTFASFGAFIFMILLCLAYREV